MLFRMGINLGDILIQGDDILGDGVNIAARLEGIAEPGGICISSSPMIRFAARSLSSSPIWRAESQEYRPSRAGLCRGLEWAWLRGNAAGEDAPSRFQYRAFPWWCCHLQISAAPPSKTTSSMV